jgi:glucose/mannose-6-phosphate isomerase
MLKLTVLDQPEKVEAIDKSGMLGLCEKLPDFCQDAVERAEKARIHCKTPKNIIIAGMGGSAIGGELLKGWLSDKSSVPIEVSRDYLLPAYADQDSLVIAISYSGETEETLSAFLEALKSRCMIATLSSGGHLQAFSQKLEIPHIAIPSNLVPRAAVGYTFFPLVVVMEKLGIAKDVKGEVDEALRLLRRLSEENGLKVPLESNEAKRLASEINGTVPIFYGFRQYEAVARRLKCQFNENSKIPGKFDTFPELDHNEIVGWEASENLTNLFSIILVRDPEEPHEIKQRIEITKQIISPKAGKVLEIQARGKQKLAKMLSTMYVGDFASIYLAVLRGVDPTPTKTISHLKQEMKKKLDTTRRLEEEIEKIR